MNLSRLACRRLNSPLNTITQYTKPYFSKPLPTVIIPCFTLPSRTQIRTVPRANWFTPDFKHQVHITQAYVTRTSMFVNPQNSFPKSGPTIYDANKIYIDCKNTPLYYIDEVFEPTIHKFDPSKHKPLKWVDARAKFKK